MVGVSNYAVIRLDTTAPVVTWGPPSDVIASEEMTIPYAVNEPGIESADILLGDGRVVPLAVAADALSATLPDDAPEGWATVRAYVVDDVGNRATRTLQVYVTGVIPTQPSAAPGLPHPPVFEPELHRSEPSRAATRSIYALGAMVSTTARGGTRSAYVTPTPRALATVAHLDLRVSWTSSATLATSSSRATARSQDMVRKRPEGPDAEDELFLLGLL